MNIFYLAHDLKQCAEYHCDKHVVKMILEYAQLLSTAHRVLDGAPWISVSDSGRKRQNFALDSTLDDVLYRATHINHPSAVWVRKSRNNYYWLFGLFDACLKEYTHRYGKTHATSRLWLPLYLSPDHMSNDPFTQPPPAMPDEYKVAGDSIKSYRNYYLGDKQRMFSWKNRPIPDWITV